MLRIVTDWRASLASNYQSAVIAKIIVESLAAFRHCAADLAYTPALPAQIRPSVILLSLYILGAHGCTSAAM